MKRSVKIAGIAALGVLAMPGLAAAQMLAVATTDLNMRAGPGPGYSVIGVVPGNGQVTVHQCTNSMNWCEVSYGARTGWSYTPYLATNWDAAPHSTVVIAGPAPHYPHATYRRSWNAGPPLGIAGGALAGALIGGPPGAIIGGFAGGVLGAGASATDNRHWRH